MSLPEPMMGRFDPDAVVLTKKVHKKRGSWSQLPADLVIDDTGAQRPELELTPVSVRFNVGTRVETKEASW